MLFINLIPCGFIVKLQHFGLQQILRAACVIFISDIDECAVDRNLCQPYGSCENRLGSYVCVCNHGYVLSEDSHSCEGKPVLIYFTRMLESHSSECQTSNSCMLQNLKPNPNHISQILSHPILTPKHFEALAFKKKERLKFYSDEMYTPLPQFSASFCSRSSVDG